MLKRFRDFCVDFSTAMNELITDAMIDVFRFKREDFYE